MKKTLICLPIVALVSLPVLTFGTISCSEKPNEDESKNVVNDEEKQESALFFYGIIFDTNYFQNMLLDYRYEEIHQDQVVEFALQHPMLSNFNQNTQSLIKSNLNNLRLDNKEGLKKISLEINNITFVHQLTNWRNAHLNAYTIDKENKKVNVDFAKLNSLSDVFNVFSDIWNLQDKYNAFTPNPYSKIYDYQINDQTINHQSLAYISKRAKISNLLGNVSSWNFDYQINFTNGSTNFDGFRIDEYQANYEFVEDLTKIYDEKYDPEKWTIKVDDKYQKNRSNYSIYPIYQLNNLSQSNQVLETYSILPLNTYLYFDKIWASIFQDFALLVKSPVFKSRALQKDFNQDVSLYQYNSQNETIALEKLANVKYDDQVAELKEVALNQENLTYVQWMFAQFIFNTQYYDNLKQIDITENDFAQIELEEQKPNLMVNDLQNDQFILTKSPVYEFAKLPSDDSILAINLPIQAKYGYAFNIFAQNNQPFGLQKTSLNNYQLKYVNQQLAINDQILNATLKVNDDEKMFFEPNIKVSNLVSLNYLPNIQSLITSGQIEQKLLAKPSFLTRPPTWEEIVTEMNHKTSITYDWIAQEKFNWSWKSPNNFFLDNKQQPNYHQNLTFNIAYHFHSLITKKSNLVSSKTSIIIKFSFY